MSNGQLSLFEDNPDYDAFVEKFKPKKTTDDCYTPPLVYDAVRDWACSKYGIDPEKIVRPFYPDGDYEQFEYPEGCCVLDNPPFSILTRICEFYLHRNIPFFLFAPSLTVFSGRKTVMRMNHIICDADITYENGAVVRTAFVTNLAGDMIAEAAPDLHEAIKNAQKDNRPTIPKYTYPDYVITSSVLARFAKYGIPFSVRRSDCLPLSRLDAQKPAGKTIFGAGLLLSERAAAERAAAERAAAERAGAIEWELSDREMEMVRKLGKEEHT